jgi:glycosyltransferase involved in cell wall biosynthesis
MMTGSIGNMAKATTKRVGVFLANWEWNSALSNTVKALSDQGYEVDVFLSRNHLFDDPHGLNQWPGVRIYDLGPAAGSNAPRAGNHTRNVFKAVLKKALPSSAHSVIREIRHACWHLTGSEKGLLEAPLVTQTLSLMEGKSYRCLIGIEKNGLFWAGRVAAELRIPFLYYSLELYNDDYARLGLFNSFSFGHTRWAERKYHHQATATIVQDVDRARVLLESNGLPMSGARIAYLPVSLLGKPCTHRSSFLRDTLGIPRERKIILYFGHIRERRYALDVAQVAQEAPEDWVFVMHGFSPPDTVNKIERANVKKRVILSLKPVSPDQVQEVISSADIGLAMYSPLTENERLTAFSSEKMALYMQCGVPFIAFDYPGYRRLATEDGCGVVIRETSELLQGVATILATQEEFRQRAYQAFSKYYDMAANFSVVSQTIEHLGNGFPKS